MTDTFLGDNAHQKIQTIIEEKNYKKVFLVTNKNSFLTGGVSDYIFQSLIGCQYHRFNNFSINPKFEDLQLGIKEYHDFKPDLIIGVGGGSAMDMAKLIHYMSDHDFPTKEIMIEQLQSKPEKDLNSKLMLIPSTSGSGSEATQFAVIYIDNKKYSLDSPYILPDYCIVDGVFTASLPKNVTAYTGADALCQALESYWATKATSASKEYAIKALKLIVKNLESSVKNPTPEIRTNMALGAYYAGKAINITRTTAPHAFSYYLTTKYGYPHGHAVSIILPYFIEENAKKIDLKEVFEAFEVTNATQLKEKVTSLFQKINLYTELNSILKNDQDDFLDSVNLERLKNNPAQFSKEEYKKLFIL
jgi:alcohol dehydrogenase class IV